MREEGMVRRLVGTLLFLIPAMGLFEIAGRLASEGCGSWWAFLAAGWAALGVATNCWVGEFPLPRCPACRKPEPPDELL
jgi:hypothetical protein